MIRIDLDTTEVVPGARVKGRVLWTSDGGKQAKRIEVVWQRRISGKAKSTTEIDSAEIDVAEGQSQVSLPFDFAVDPEAALSYAGKTFQLAWEIVATADIPWAPDPSATSEIKVRPATWSLEQFEKWSADRLLEEEGDDDEDDDDEDVSESTPETRPGSR